jgi:hypothetical protein
MLIATSMQAIAMTMVAFSFLLMAITLCAFAFNQYYATV